MVTVTVPYDKTNEGEVKFVLSWEPVFGLFPYQEGGYFEVVETIGFFFDDDYPDLEEFAFLKASEALFDPWTW